MTSVLSIVVPCFRQSHLVGDAIRSIAELGGRDRFEIVVVDDGSPDDVAAAVAPWGDRVRLVRQENQGLSRARNAGIEAATSDYVMFLDADDVAHPELDIVPARLDGRDAFLGSYVIEKTWSGEQTRHYAGVEGGLSELVERNLGAVFSCIVRRKVALAIGGFDPYFQSCEDWDFWIRVWRTGPTWASLDVAFGVYRLYESSMATDFARMWRSARQVWAKHADLATSADALPLPARESLFYRYVMADRLNHQFIACTGVRRWAFWCNLWRNSPETARRFLADRCRKRLRNLLPTEAAR